MLPTVHVEYDQGIKGVDIPYKNKKAGLPTHFGNPAV